MRLRVLAGIIAAAFATPAFAGDCGSTRAAELTPAQHHVTGPADIVDTAVAAGDFSTLVTAVQAAGLVDTLKGPGPFTVFAPADAAFARLPDGTVNSLLQPQNQARLRDILTFHVVAGRYTAADLAGQVTRLPTVNGEIIAIDGTDGVRVETAQVVAADIETANGVIHVIDRVIIPADRH